MSAPSPIAPRLPDDLLTENQLAAELQKHPRTIKCSRDLR